ITQGSMAAVVIVVSLVLYRPLLALSFSPQKAESLGMHPKLTHVLLLVLIAAAVIGSFQAVGTMLVFGLLVGPPAFAALVARTVKQMFVISVVVGAFSVWLGLMLSYHLGTAGSATMALVPITLFFAMLIIKQTVRRVRDNQRRRASSALDPLKGTLE
ncbi:MAG: metal ABC transporter permease, partial [Propionibacterium sp.]|nr:metal ABC transporter permease [Propionibacterium sp.]